MELVSIKDLKVGELYQDVQDEDMHPCVMKFKEFKNKSIVFEYISGYDGYKDEDSNNIELELTKEMSFNFYKV